MHIHPTITELIPTMLGELKPLEGTRSRDANVKYFDLPPKFSKFSPNPGISPETCGGAKHVEGWIYFLISTLCRRIVPHSPAPSSRRPCRRALPEWRCASSRSLALRRANVFR